MKNPFTIDKSYKIRHRILGILYKDWEEHNHEENRRVGSVRIASETNIPIAEIHRWQNLLVEKGEITVSDNDGQFMMSIQQNGKSAYVDKRYLKAGVKERWDKIYDWARIVIPLAALVLSIINYISNRNLNQKVKNSETKIQELQKK
jgi:hypothetical protein